MSSSFPNPFALPEKPPRRPLAASLKGLGVLGGLLVVVLLLQSQTRQWLLQRWDNGFAELPAGEQLQRLLQISQLGDLAIETVSRRVAAADDRVGHTAVDLLRQRQAQWKLRDNQSLAAAHMQMLIGLDAVIDDLPQSRQSAVRELLEQTVQQGQEPPQGQAPRQDSGDHATAMSDSVRVAQHLLGRLTKNGSAVGPSLAEQQASELLNRRRDIAASAATNAMPPVAAQSRTPTAGHDSAAALLPQPASLAASPGAGSPSGAAAHRSDTAVMAKTAAATLRPEQTVHRVVSAGETSRVVHGEYLRSIDQTPLRTFDTRTVIGMLASDQTTTRDQAVEELVQRGLSNEEIRLANQLASSEIQVRLGLLESLGRRGDIDPRRWLLWLAEDTQREVRLRAVTALYAMNDAAVIAELRKRLSNEADPMVIAALRQVIDQRR